MKRERSAVTVFLALVILLAGCATSKNVTENIDSWKAISGVDEFAGRWEGSISVRVPEDKKEYIPESSIEISIFLEYIKNTTEISSGMKIDLSRFLADWENVAEMRQLGITKDQLWEMLSEAFNRDVSIRLGGKYFLTMDLSGTTDEYMSDETAEFFINNKGTRLKIVFSEVVKFDMGDSGFREIILDKK